MARAQGGPRAAAPLVGGDPTARLRAEIERLKSELARSHAKRERLEAEIERLEAERVAQIAAALERERDQLAQRLHDEPMQDLIAVHRELIAAAPGRAGATRAHEIVKEMIDALRESLAALRGAAVRELGLERALQAAAADAGRLGRFEVALEIEPAALDAHPELVRGIARELLMNAARHSGATQVVVRLRRTERSDRAEFELEVGDDGKGIGAGRLEQARAEGHIGLASIEQRAHEAGGELELETSPAGTRAVVRLPV